MIKYEIFKSEIEYTTKKFKSAEDAFFALDGGEWAESVGLFESLDEAKNVLETIEVSTTRRGRVSTATVAYIMEAEYDEDEEEFISGGDYLAFKEDIEKEVSPLDRDFEIVIKAKKYDKKRNRRPDEGYIVKYDNEFLFVEEDEVPLKSCSYWILEVERNFFFEDLYFDEYIYFDENHQPITAEKLSTFSNQEG